MSSQRHKLWEQGATAAGEIHAQGVVAPGIAMQVDPQAYNVLKAGPPLYNTGLELRAPPDLTDVVVPVGEYGGPLSGSTLTGAIPEELVSPGPNPEPPDPDVITPSLTSLHPASAPIQTGDMNVRILGTGFTEETVMVWNGADDVAAYISDTEMTTVVKTDMATVPSTCTVMMRNGASNISNVLNFELVDGTPEGRRGARQDGRSFPMGPFNIISVRRDNTLGQLVYTLDGSAGDQIKNGDTILVEATGNSAINGTYTAENVAGPQFSVTTDTTISQLIEDKGRVTIIAGA
jgi:hypothetical protein